MTGAVAKRYARALAGVAADQGRLEQTEEELERVSAWLADPEVEAAFASPNLAVGARRGLVGRLAESLDLSELSRNFLLLLAERGRLDQLRGIVQAYQSLVDRSLGRVRAHVRSAAPLGDSSVDEIRGVLEQIAKKRVLVSVDVDPSLIAGVAVEIEGRIYDGSVRTQLRHLTGKMAREVSAT